ncbi:GyrI-like domain-containing protein [Demequina sp. NBRC 110054]|uniref:GyrI-like domain-containing protein n=1 Tax=Demequina sp. NBRC 110054 TaxID=1570343 RepID=UPI0009FD3B5B|nr:GyrI-like domain-containing protein [Demequina sp. NBRC 110054]
MSDKVDPKRTLDSYAARKGEFRIVRVPPMRYLAVDGHGDPNTSPAFERAIGALYPVAYALKFASKARGHDYVVPPLEGLWWSEDMDSFAVNLDKSQWSWTLLLLIPDTALPEPLDDAMVATATEAAAAKAPDAGVEGVRVETIDEGECVQTLHVGPFDDEAPVIARMHEEFMPAHGLRPSAHHHEIYLSDFRRAAPEKLRTILRQPVARV